MRQNEPRVQPVDWHERQTDDRNGHQSSHEAGNVCGNLVRVAISAEE